MAWINLEENDAYTWDAKHKFHDAMLGDRNAQNDLGVCYQYGMGVPLNLDKAFYWVSKAADAGLPVAMYNLGQLYHEGIGCSKDDCKAFFWWRNSANAGYEMGVYNTGVAYYLGIGTPINFNQAEKVFLKLANENNSDAMNYLGLIYSNTAAPLYNITEARYWFNKGISLGNYMCEQNKRKLT